MTDRRPVRLLSEDTIRRIAAGEVITRPAAAVKELIENSLDADATDIKVEVKDGGKNLIKVSDNGFGMTREDARLAVTRHATSKLQRIEDLDSLASFGFRGEALAAIAAVSRLLVETNTSEAEPGTKLEVEGGDVRSVSEVAHPVGTSVSARMLFYNLPARRSFLKSDNYELKLVAETVKTYAASNPDVGFELSSNGRQVLSVRAGSLKDRLRDLYGPQTAEALVEVKVENPMLSFRGFLSDPSQVKGFYEAQQVFFNRRPVRSRTITRAVYDSYGPAIAGRNPNFILFIDTDPARLDVNIHPTKQEVRFADERFLFDFVSEACGKALGLKRTEQAGIDEFLFQESMALGEDAPAGFWQLHNCFIMAQVATGYVIVDQHAAHERIIFEEVSSRRREVASQGLLFAIQLELGPDEYAAYESVAPALGRMGIEVKPFSGRTVMVESVPAGSYMAKDELREFFSELARTAAGKAVPEVELAKLVACKAAVKAGQRLSASEMESLINRLFQCKEPHFCPHGRPAIIKVSLEELERRFGRT